VLGFVDGLLLGTYVGETEGFELGSDVGDFDG